MSMRNSNGPRKSTSNLILSYINSLFGASDRTRVQKRQRMKCEKKGRRGSYIVHPGLKRKIQKREIWVGK